jgi:hypothetical protein
MGHSHSWYRPDTLDKTKFRKAVDAFKKIMPELEKKVELVGIEERPKPIVEEYGVFFAVGRLPWFVLSCVYVHQHRKRPGETMHFDSVKTYANPGYDLAVMSCLIVFKHYFGEDLKVCSDATIEGWQPAIALVKEKLGFTEDWEFKTTIEDGLTSTILVSKEAA